MTDGYDSHRARRALLGDDVAVYEQGRPPYPARVFELLQSAGALRTGRSVLEIGPGTGQATVALLDAGAHVTAVELSEAFADRLADRFAARAFTVLRGPFESAELAAGSFDLVVAATSFHWIIPTGDALVRCADLLRTGGWLAPGGTCSATPHGQTCSPRPSTPSCSTSSQHWRISRHGEAGEVDPAVRAGRRRTRRRHRCHRPLRPGPPLS